MKKKCKKSLGGQLLQTGVSFIPGVGQVLAPLVGMVDQQMDAQKLAEEQRKLNVPPIKINTNPYGSFKNGGVLQDGFKQYNTGSHASGGDLTVNMNGDPDPNGDNTVQNKENSFRVDNKQYVFSDVLKLKGRTFNKVAAEINKKYPNSRTDMDQRKALDFEMKQLSKKNDALRDVEESQKAFGGPLYTKSIQNASKYWKDNQYPVVGEDQVPAAGANMFTQNAQDLSMTIPPANKNMFVDNSRPPLSIDPLPAIPADYQGIEMATDTTPIPGGNSPELTLGQNLADVPGTSTNPLVPKASNRSSDVLGAKGANAIALGLKGAALAGSIYDALQPSEKEKLILPDYRKSDAYVKSANVDYTQAKQDAIGVSNIGGNMNRSLAGNAAQFQGREQSRLAQLQDSLGRISEGENNARSSLNMTKGNYEQGKAVDTANRTYQSNVNQQMNDANTRFFDRTLSSELSQIGSEFNKYSNTQKINSNNQELNKFQVNQQLMILNSKYPNFKVDANVMELLKSGASIDEIIKMKT